MASRKRKPDSPQIGLTFAGPSLPPSVDEDQIPAHSPEPTGLVDTTAADLGLAPAELAPSSDASPNERDTAAHAFGATDGAGIDLESFDDYDDGAMHDDVPRLHLVDPPREVSVIIEAVDGRYWVTRLRDGGTTVASVLYTRKELEELIGRAQAALEM